MKILYCDCFSGISGDMFLGALIDAGLPVEYLAEQLNLLDLHEFEGVSANKINKGAIQATLIDFDIHEHSHDPDDGHDHHHHHDDHDHDEGHEHHHGHDHHHHHDDRDHDGDHEHHEEHEHHHHHASRNFKEIRDLIGRSRLSDSVKQTSIKIFQQLANAEAKVHGTTADEVHFHEVGAVDSILDIVGAAVGLAYFDIQQVYSSALPLGTGTVLTQHGLLPLPAPATMELMRVSNIPVVASNATQELVTPTGAALLATLASFRQPDMLIERVGTGAGKRDLEWPNIFRVLIGNTENDSESHIEIETNIDDMNPQLFGYVMAKLFTAGALDVYFTPIYMKKNRPATKLSVIARQADEAVMCDILLQETSTLGVRVSAVRRNEAKREMRTIETAFGTVPVKLKIMNNRIIQAAPEYDVCANLAEKSGSTLAIVLQEANAKSQELIGSEINIQ